MKKQLLALAAAVAVSPAAMAQQGYFGADFSFVSAEVSADTIFGSFSDDFDPTALRVRGGIGLNENFAVEGVLGLGLQDDEVELAGIESEFGLDRLVGINAVAIIPMDRSFSVFGKVGFASVGYEGDAGDSIDDTGISVGFGAKVNFDRNGSGLVIEYTVLPDVEDDDSSLEVESDMISIGAQFAF